MTKIALVDDHTLLRSGLAAVINSFGDYEVVLEADHGKHFIELLQSKPTPDMVLLDINMPEMDGFETIKWIRNNVPSIKVLVLSMRDDDQSIIRMLQQGARGYILKDSRPDGLRNALREVNEKGFFFNELVSSKLVYIINNNADPTGANVITLSDKEIEFLKWCCTEKSYKEIAVEMNISTRAVESLRSNMFEKLETLSRVGLVMYAIKNGIVKV